MSRVGIGLGQARSRQPNKLNPWLTKALKPRLVSDDQNHEAPEHKLLSILRWKPPPFSAHLSKKNSRV